MPKVPIYENQVGVSHTPQSYNQVSVKPQAFGDYGWTDNAAKALNEANKVLQERQDKIRTSMAFEASDQMDKLAMDSFFDPEKGYLAKQGKAAMGGSKAVLDEYNKRVNEDIISKINDVETQNKLQEVLSRKEYSYARAVMAHDLQQTSNYHNDVTKSILITQADLAIKNRNNPIGIQTAIANTIQAIDANPNETDPEIKQTMKNEAVSNIHFGVISAMLSDNNPNTKAYFEKNKNALSATDNRYDNIINAVNANDIDNQARNNTDRIMSMGLSFSKQLAEARKIKDVKVSDATVNRIKEREQESRYNETQKEQQQKEKYNNNIEAFWKSYEKNPNPSSIPSWVSHDDKMSMLNYTEAIIKAGQPKDIKTNQGVWYQLYNMAVEKPDEFKKLNLLKYKAYLSDSDFQEITKLKKVSGTPEYTSIISPYQEVKNVATSLGLVKKKDVQEASKLQYTVQTAMQAEEQARGKKFTAPERSEFIKNFGYKANHPGKEYDTTFDIYQRGMENNSNFIKDTINDFKYFEKVNKRPPDIKERNDIIYQRANRVIQNQNINTINNLPNVNVPNSKSNGLPNVGTTLNFVSVKNFNSYKSKNIVPDGTIVYIGNKKYRWTN